MERPEEKVWFAMRATYRRELLAQRRLEGRSIESFIPMRYEIGMKERRRTVKATPAVRNLIFVHTTRSEMQRAKADIPCLQYMTTPGGGNVLIVPDEQMRRFIAITAASTPDSLYLSPDQVNLAKGTRVRIRGGALDGQQGVFVKVKGARDRRIVVAIEGVVAVAFAAVHPARVEILDDEIKPIGPLTPHGTNANAALARA